MKKFHAHLLLAGSVSLLALAAPASAQTFNWSFIDDYYGHPEITIAGTISDLTEGNNNAAGLSVTITSSPVPASLGQFTYDGSSGNFFVSGGQVTYANAYFFNSSSNYYLFFGTSPGSSTWYPELYAGGQYPDLASETPTQFSARSVPEVGSWAMMIAGFGMTGAAMRRRRSVALSFG